MCDPRDLGRAERVRDPHFGSSAIYFYDKYPGGTGLAEALAAAIGGTVAAAIERLASCGCSGGCPSCVGVDFLGPGETGAVPSAIDGAEVKGRSMSLLKALSAERRG